MTIRPLTAADWGPVSEIYREGIESGHATFETELPEWADWDASRRPDCRLVATHGGRILGFAALTAVSGRPVYAGVAEVMIYVAGRARGRGVGTELMGALVESSEAAGVWTLQASVFPENAASIRMHERAGFRTVGRRVRIGRFHDGRWRDTVLLERRSERVGVDEAMSAPSGRS